ncbi:hypothetical protein [Streptomyces sp. NPDC048516]|uniref:hypothetical protein n=1 Tax=Streptomyces sp. NPDC048516 TaxID=3365565 RepID=UPI003713423F
MADDNFNAVPCAPALPHGNHPSARPGYGKREVSAQHPSRPGDFAHLPRREASIAAYLDRLPEGADISVKTLAKVLPDYGRCALRTALRRLSEAGHRPSSVRPPPTDRDPAFPWRGSQPGSKYDSAQSGSAAKRQSGRPAERHCRSAGSK